MLLSRVCSQPVSQASRKRNFELYHRYIEEATTREWSMMAEQTPTRK
jgi:hypothetical protein